MQQDNVVPLLLGQLEEGRVSNLEEESTRNEVGVESLDYDPIHNVVYARQKRANLQRHFYGYTGLTLAKWLITITIGILVGLVAYIVDSSQEVMITMKKNWTQIAIDEGLKLPLVFLCYSAVGVLLVTMSSCLVLLWAPAAAGGGVTLVMAYLNGIDIPNFFESQTLVTKILGTICTISSGLPIGQEGPMVYIGAAIASTLTWMHGPFPTQRKQRLKWSYGSCLQKINKCVQRAWPFDFHNDKDRREFISAGAAAGLAAAFGAPIGGVLFSLEEASSFWSRKMMWRSLLCTTMATMVLAWLKSRDFSLSLPGSLAFHGFQVEIDLDAVPLIVVTAAALGVLGALLNTIHGWLAKDKPPSNVLLRIAEACFITCIAVAFMFLLSHVFGRCLPVQEGQMGNEYWFRYTCPEADPNNGVSYYNDLATLYFAVPHQTIKQLLAIGSDVDTYFSIRSLAVHSVSFFALFNLAYGIATPGGIFMPSIMVGASFGGFLGRVFKIYFADENIQPGLHALVGATAMLGGVFRSSLSLVVIMMEGTGGIEYLLPAIVAIFVGNWVAHHIHHAGAYEADLERLGEVRFLQSEPPRHLISVTAAEMMAPNVITLTEIVSVPEVVKVLRNTQHNGFPVIRHTEPQDSGQLVGLILRHQLLLLLEERAQLIEVDSEALRRPIGQRLIARSPRVTREHVYLEHAMRVYHHCHHPHKRFLSSRPGAVDDLELDDILQQEGVATNGFTGAAQGNIKETRNFTDEAAAPGKSKQQQAAANWRLTELALDLRCFVNRAPVTVRAECSAHRAYMMFRTLGLRHLCVMDSSNRVIGMITRKDLALQAQKRADVHSEGSSKLALDRQESSDGSSSCLSDRTNKHILFSLP